MLLSVVFLLSAALAGVNAAVFASTGEPVTLGVAVFGALITVNRAVRDALSGGWRV